MLCASCGKYISECSFSVILDIDSPSGKSVYVDFDCECGKKGFARISLESFVISYENMESPFREE